MRPSTSGCGTASGEPVSLFSPRMNSPAEMERSWPGWGRTPLPATVGCEMESRKPKGFLFSSSTPNRWVATRVTPVECSSTSSAWSRAASRASASAA